MAKYYIDTKNGSNKNDGMSESSALKNDNELKLLPGDTVLYKCGTVIRGKINNVSGDEGNPITYSSYGEGEYPIICGSIDVSKRELWKETEKNIWVCDMLKDHEVGNFVFDSGFGALRWSKEELREQGDFFDSCFGYSRSKKPFEEDHCIYLYSIGNPADVYKSIEASVYGNVWLAITGHDMIFEKLTFKNSGVHAIAGFCGAENITVRKCNFINIGGCVWGKERKIRFGNAFEAWNIAKNVEITDCIFDNIYDSGVTHQGNKECQPADGFYVHGNTFTRCGMAAYEQRDLLPLRAEFKNNICADAGEGFSKLGEEMPRNSEIWPQPMGHHIFLWRIEKPTENAVFEIKDNKFLSSPYGEAIYSIIASEPEKQMKVENNIYAPEESMINKK